MLLELMILMSKKYSFLGVLILLLSVSTLSAQEIPLRESDAVLLHKQYKFDEAIAAYKRLSGISTDSITKIQIENKIVQCLNGKSMLQYAFKPSAVAKEKVPFFLFFLKYLGFDNGKWVETPRLLSSSNGQYSYMFMPDNAKQIYYSAPDKDGAWNIYMIGQINDSLWSYPKLMNEGITTIGNEIFPYLSSDGKSLYFSSNGHYGVGGYDLYVSHWNEENKDWDTPQNLGFPFSSPDNDYLYYDTPDGQYTLFASDREIGKDSLTLYAIEFENLPLKYAVTQKQALEYSHLQNQLTNNNATMTDTPSDSSTKSDSKYSIIVKHVRLLQRQLDSLNKKIENNRKLYSSLSDSSDIISLSRAIKLQEAQAIAQQSSLNNATDSLQKIEMDFLSKGIIVTMQEDKTRNIDNNAQPAFKFADNQLGKSPQLVLEEPEPDLNLYFNISKDESQIYPFSELPTSLVYQIQLFSLTKSAGPKTFKGLTPIFERKISAAKFVYSAGIFGTHAEALGHLNSVKKLGFVNASIIAVNNGTQITVKNAQIIEKENKDKFFYQITITGSDDVLPEKLLKAIKENCDKDLAKTVEDSSTIYVIGPFEKEVDAEKLAAILREISDLDIQITQKNQIKTNS